MERREKQIKAKHICPVVNKCSIQAVNGFRFKVKANKTATNSLVTPSDLQARPHQSTLVHPVKNQRNVSFLKNPEDYSEKAKT